MSDSLRPHGLAPSMGFSRQEYWSGLPFPSPGYLPNTGIEPGYPTLEADALTSEPPGKPFRDHAAKSRQSCPTLCDPVDGSPPGSAVLGILQARVLERVAISFSRAWKWKVKVKSPSRVRLLATSWTAAYQALLSMGFFQARVLEWGAISFSIRDHSYVQN